MIAATDYTGLAALIAAFTGLVAAIGAILNGRTARAVHESVKTANGQTIGQLVENTAIVQAVEHGVAPGEGQPAEMPPDQASPRS